MGLHRTLRDDVCTEPIVGGYLKGSIIVFVSCVAITVAAVQQRSTAAKEPPTYELYSWQDDKGAWDFSLLYTTSRQKTAEEVFNDKAIMSGVGKLRQRMSKLPKGSTIVWFDKLTFSGIKIKGTEKLKYPPKEIIDQVKSYAQKHTLKVLGP